MKKIVFVTSVAFSIFLLLLSQIISLLDHALMWHFPVYFTSNSIDRHTPKLKDNYVRGHISGLQYFMSCNADETQEVIFALTFCFGLTNTRKQSRKCHVKNEHNAVI